MDILDRLKIEARNAPHEPIWRDAIRALSSARSSLKALHTRAVVDGELDPAAVRLVCEQGLEYADQSP